MSTYKCSVLWWRQFWISEQHKKNHRNFGTFQPSLIANDSEVSGKSNLKYSPKGLC